MPRYALRSAVSVGSHYRARLILRKRFLKKTSNKVQLAQKTHKTHGFLDKKQTNFSREDFEYYLNLVFSKFLV